MPKASAQSKTNTQAAEVQVSRPRIPRVYGIPKNNKGLLDWAHVQERMRTAKVYWICTSSPDSRPHAIPVDGIWLDDKLFFGGDPTTRSNRNLNANPHVNIHLEGGMDVVVLEGDALPLGKPDPELAVRLAQASNQKYGYGVKPEQYSRPGTYVFRPRLAFAWTQFPMDVTRWVFKTSN